MMDIDLLKSLFNVGKTKKSFEIITNLLHLFGNPQHQLPPVIHITGTNGKGSTTAFLYAALRTAGLRVHRLTSPHLCCITERIVVANRPIAPDKLEFYLRKIAHMSNGEISFLEALTASGLCAFSETPADIALIEVGVGGLWDGTNVVSTTCASVITPISIDHQNILGHTLAEIAFQKSGIMRPDIPCISAPQCPEVRQEIEVQAQRIGAPLWMAPQDWGYTLKDQGVVVHYGTCSSVPDFDPKAKESFVSNIHKEREYEIQEQNSATQTQNEWKKFSHKIRAKNTCSMGIRVQDSTDGIIRVQQRNNQIVQEFDEQENLGSIDFFPHIGLVGAHQRTNAALAAMTLHAQKAVFVPFSAIAQGFETVFWPGRLQNISLKHLPADRARAIYEENIVKPLENSPVNIRDTGTAKDFKKTDRTVYEDQAEEFFADRTHPVGKLANISVKSKKDLEKWDKKSNDVEKTPKAFYPVAQKDLVAGETFIVIGLKKLDPIVLNATAYPTSHLFLNFRTRHEVWIDGAHNAGGFRVLSDYIIQEGWFQHEDHKNCTKTPVDQHPHQDQHPQKSLVVLLGMLPRKNPLSFWTLVAPLAAQVWVVESWGNEQGIPLNVMQDALKSRLHFGAQDRNLNAQDLQFGMPPDVSFETKASVVQSKAQYARSFATLDLALQEACSLDVSRFLICGSLHLVGYFLNCSNQIYLK